MLSGAEGAERARARARLALALRRSSQQQKLRSELKLKLAVLQIRNLLDSVLTISCRLAKNCLLLQSVKKLKCSLLGEYLAIWNWNPCREAPRDGVSGRPCSLAEMAIPDAVVRRHATNKVVI